MHGRARHTVVQTRDEPCTGIAVRVSVDRECAAGHGSGGAVSSKDEQESALRAVLLVARSYCYRLYICLASTAVANIVAVLCVIAWIRPFRCGQRTQPHNRSVVLRQCYPAQ